MHNHSDIKEFTQLITFLGRLFTVAKDDTKREHVFTAALALSERFAALNTHAPQLTDWLLSTHIETLPYSVKLTLIRVALICRLCTNLDYRQQDTQQLLLASVLDSVVIAELLELQAQHVTLSEKQIALWRKRASTIFSHYDINANSHFELADTLAKIAPYEYRIMSNQAKPLHSHYGRVVAFANVMSRQMLPTKQRKARSMQSAFFRTYSKTADPKVRDLCRAMIANSQPQLAGATQIVDSESLLYLGRTTDDESLFIRGSLSKPRIVKAKRMQWQDNLPTALANIDSLRRALTVQMHVQIDSMITKKNSEPLNELAADLQVFRDATAEEAAEHIKHSPALAQSVCAAAKDYNRSHIDVANVRHAISMIGLANIKHFSACQRLKHAMLKIQTPMSALITARIEALMQVIDNLHKQHRTIEKDEIKAAFYLYFLLTLVEGKALSRARAMTGLADASAPLSHLIGAQPLAHQDLHTAADNLQAANAWLGALLTSESKDPRHFNDKEQLCCLIKQLTLFAYDIKSDTNPWRMQFIDSSLKQQLDLETTNLLAHELILNTSAYEVI